MLKNLIRSFHLIGKHRLALSASIFILVGSGICILSTLNVLQISWSSIVNVMFTALNMLLGLAQWHEQGTERPETKRAPAQEAMGLQDFGNLLHYKQKFNAITSHMHCAVPITVIYIQHIYEKAALEQS